MSLFMPVQRATLLVPTNGSNHLFVLLTNPKQPIDYACMHNLIVPIGTIYSDRPSDLTCKLYVGDHPFIRHDSYVNYRFCHIEETAKLNKGCKDGVFQQYDNISSEIFARVCKGLEESRHTPLKMQQFYQAECQLKAA